MSIALKTWAGIAGVPNNEKSYVNYIGAAFEWVTLLIALWLPIQWHLEHVGDIDFFGGVIIDWLVWGIFVSEMVIMLLITKRKWQYFSGNWMNLIIIAGLFPFVWEKFPILGSLRFLRVLLALFLVVPWMGTGHRFLQRNQIWTTLIVFVVVILLGGLIITTFDSGITNPLQGIWWALVTVTTVGYGDVAPTTWAGKVFAAFVMCMGFGIFSLLTAHISSYFIGQKNHEEQKKNRDLLISHIEALNEKIESLSDRVEALGEKK